MNNYLDNNGIPRQNLMQNIQDKFPTTQVDFRTLRFGDGIITVFMPFFETGEMLAKSWRSFSTTVALYYQSQIENEFERWNIYIIYICQQTINLQLRYEIENDKISSRKIIEQLSVTELTYDNFLRLCNTHILINDIVMPIFTDSNSKREKYIGETNAWQLIHDTNIKSGKGSKDAFDDLLTRIEKLL